MQQDMLFFLNECRLNKDEPHPSHQLVIDTAKYHSARESLDHGVNRVLGSGSTIQPGLTIITVLVDLPKGSSTEKRAEPGDIQR